MPLLTPNFQLPYPAPLDEPCDFAQQWCDLSDRFQTVLDDFQSTADRVTPVIPVARLLVTAPVTVVREQEIPFDTLSVDTAAWVDFDADPSGITVKQGGYFCVLGNAQVATTGVAGRIVLLTLPAFPLSDSLIDRGNAGQFLGLNATGTLQVTSNRRFSMNVSDTTVVTTNTYTINKAHLAVFWISDRATP